MFKIDSSNKLYTYLIKNDDKECREFLFGFDLYRFYSLQL